MSIPNQLNVSEATIRKDLPVLEESELLKRVHGGAISSMQSNAHDINFLARAQTQQREKQAIARAALQYIDDHDSVLLDASSTCYQLAQLLNRTTTQVTVVPTGLLRLP